jgi:prepilin-type N-terminal cleavage/methylation domain-containing protein
MKKIHLTRGFTLIEVLIYLGLFAILMSGALVGAYQLLQGGAHTRSLTFTQAEGTFINRKINWALTGASNPVVSAGGAKLDLDRVDLGTVLHFDASGTNLTLSGNTSPTPVILNSDEFKPSNLLFAVTPAQSDGTPALVTVTFTIQGVPFVLKKYLD